MEGKGSEEKRKEWKRRKGMEGKRREEKGKRKANASEEIFLLKSIC